MEKFKEIQNQITKNGGSILSAEYFEGDKERWVVKYKNNKLNGKIIFPSRDNGMILIERFLCFLWFPKIEFEIENIIKYIFNTNCCKCNKEILKADAYKEMNGSNFPPFVFICKKCKKIHFKKRINNIILAIMLGVIICYLISTYPEFFLNVQEKLIKNKIHV